MQCEGTIYLTFHKAGVIYLTLHEAGDLSDRSQSGLSHMRLSMWYAGGGAGLTLRNVGNTVGYFFHCEGMASDLPPRPTSACEISSETVTGCGASSLACAPEARGYTLLRGVRHSKKGNCFFAPRAIRSPQWPQHPSAQLSTNSDSEMGTLKKERGLHAHRSPRQAIASVPSEKLLRRVLGARLSASSRRDEYCDAGVLTLRADGRGAPPGLNR